MKPANIYKALIPSVVVLILFSFIDMSAAPAIQKFMFPGFEPLNQSLEPVKLWWVNFFFYAIMLALIFIAEFKLKGLNEKINGRLINLIIQKYKRLTVLSGLIPFVICLCSGALVMIMGPILLMTFTLPLVIKGFSCIIVSLFVLNVYSDLQIKYEMALSNPVNNQS